MRWTVSPPEVLADALEQRFEGIYEFDNLTPFAPKMVDDRKSGLEFHSKMTSTDGVFDHDESARREIHEAEVGKIAYLRDKLNSLLESGEKTFIYKCNVGVSDALVERLASAISSRGKSRFLYVSADPEKAGLSRCGTARLPWDMSPALPLIRPGMTSTSTAGSRCCRAIRPPRRDPLIRR